MQNNQWIALFSRSGKTLANVCEQLGYWPGHIYTNQFGDFDKRILQQPNLSRLSHNIIMSTLREQHTYNHSIITLMGYLNIIPSDICESYSIFNLHPANIEYYPEYKGIHPIERIFRNNQLEALGNILHKVIAEVDSGEIIQNKPYVANTIEEAWNKTNEYAVNMWVNLLQEELQR